MAFDSKIIISLNRDCILPEDFYFDLTEGKNKAKKKIREDDGREYDPVRSDYKMDDTKFNEMKIK